VEQNYAKAVEWYQLAADQGRCVQFEVVIFLTIFLGCMLI